MAGSVLVVGSTGTVGGALVSRLEQLGEKVRAATRAPKVASAMAHSGREYVEFDLERPETFGPALEGVDRLFLIARPGDEQADRFAIPLIDEARRRGVRSVVDLSAMGIETMPDAALRKVERHLEASGLDYTHLRPNWFMQIFSTGSLRAGVCAAGAIQVPAAAARVSFIDARDIAEVAAQALRESKHGGKAYTLTGGRALDHSEVAEAISRSAGRPVRYVAIGEDVARHALETAGLSQERVERLVRFYRLVRQGLCAPVSPHVEALLRRPPTSFETFARDHAESWS
jgi:uncharacterized protein YbjT (DUF2867 family)